MTPEEKMNQFERRVVRGAIILGIFIVFLVAGVGIYLSNLQKEITTLKLQENTTKIEQVQKKQSSALIEAQSDSYQLKEKAQTITTKIKSYEKPVVRDTTYAAMCEYITGFRLTEDSTRTSP